MAEQFDASQYDNEQLRTIADSIYAHLGISGSLDLGRELQEHYRRCKRIAVGAEALFTENPSAAASALNATTAALKEVARLETDLYNAERVKVLERCMVNALREYPEAAAVLDAFEQELREAV